MTRHPEMRYKYFLGKSKEWRYITRTFKFQDYLCKGTDSSVNFGAAQQLHADMPNYTDIEPIIQ